MPEKIARPYIQGTPVHNEGGDFPARLFHIKIIHRLPQEVLEATDLLKTAKNLRDDVLEWLRREHPTRRFYNDDFGPQKDVIEPV